MALTYTSFLSYPLEITGITSEYNSRIAAIESFVVEDMEYTGEASDVSAVLKYFVFYYFCQNEATTVTAKTGETGQIQKTSFPDITRQVKAWDLGAEKLKAICDANGFTAKDKYIKGLNFFL